MGMAKTKDKPKPQKRSSQTSRKAPKQAPSKASHLSQEYVVDSEDEDAPPEDKSVKKVTSQPAPVPEPTGRKSDGVSDGSEDESAEDGDESEDELPSGGQSGKSGGANGVLSRNLPNNVPRKTNGVKRTSAQASSSGEDSEDESEDGDALEPVAKRSKTAAHAARQQASAESSEEEDGSDSEVTAPRRQAAAEEGAVSGPIPARPYQPPSGYVNLDLPATGYSTEFTSSSLESKQIWHIAAPSDVSLASIKAVALDAIQAGKPLLTHKGAEYILSETGPGSGSTIIFAPRKDSFSPAGHRVEKKVHLQQRITLPNLSNKQSSQVTGSAAAAEVAQAPVSTVRPQPKGLRMRYRPPGYGTDDPGTIGSDSDSAEQDSTRQAAHSFQFPCALGAHGTSEQHAVAGAAEQSMNGLAEKPKKKKRKEKQKDLIAQESTVNGRKNDISTAAGASTGDGAATPVATTRAKVVMPESVDGDVTMTDAAVPVKLSKEDKARRKEEKRRRREEKKKGKEVRQ